MKKLLMSLIAALFAFTMSVTTAEQAEARRYHRGAAAFGIAAAVIGAYALHRAHRRHHRRHYYYNSYYDDYGYYPRYRRSYYYAPRRHYYYGGGYGGYYGYPRSFGYIVSRRRW